MTNTLIGWPLASTITDGAARVALALAILFSCIALGAQPSPAQTLSVLHPFTGAPDGCKPEGDLYRDGAGNLYGTAANCGAAYGILFKISTTGKETILYKFTGAADGGYPEAGLIRDTSGNFYGTTYQGGTGDGVVFKFAAGKESVIHTFSGTDGAHPVAALVRDKAGNLYGTTFYGGTAACSAGQYSRLTLPAQRPCFTALPGAQMESFPPGASSLTELEISTELPPRAASSTATTESTAAASFSKSLRPARKPSFTHSLAEPTAENRWPVWFAIPRETSTALLSPPATSVGTAL